MNKSDCIVIIPTYNEKENIEKIIRAIYGLEKCFHILVIDDGSPDGTAAIVKSLMAQAFADRLFIIERRGKLGLGTAYIAGFKWALDHDYEYIFEMDADFSHDPNDLPRLYAACHDEGYDLAIGSRYVSGVNVVNWPMGRVLMSYFASKYVKLVTGFHIHDTTAGFKCYRRRVLQTIELDKIRFKGYGFQIEMKFTAWKIGFKIKEVPVIFVNRREGTSKMSGGIFGEAFFGVMRLRWDGWTRKYPKIAMMLLAALMTASACQEKKQTGDIITASYTPQQPQAPIALPADSQTVDVQWKGFPYVVRIVRTPVDSLLVTDDGGQEYYDNAVRLSVKRQDGSVLFSKTFTKNTFASYVQNPFRRMGVLGGIQFDEVSGQNLKFSVVIGLPDALDDVYVPLEMTIDSQGGLGIRQTDDMNLRDDIDADE